MKKFFLILLLTCISYNIVSRDPGYPSESSLPKRKKAKYYKLKSRFLKYLDGVTGAMDGDAIAEVIQVRKLIEDLQNGILDVKVVNGKKISEHIVFQNKNRSIAELCEIEKKFLRQYDQTRDLALRGAVIGNLDELNECLKQVKHSFIKATNKFMKRIEPAKQFVIKLIEESCNERKIPHNGTVMLDWANTNGNEEAIFNDRIKSFQKFKEFLEQVSDFLGDLMRSCEIGLGQYLNQKKENKKS